MPKNVYTYLKFVRFKNIERWDMKSLLGNSLHFKYQECKFKEILSKTGIEWVDIEDELEYPILGVHAQGEGVYINNVSKGKSLTMKRYQKSKEMSLFYCKVRTVKGQWGIVYPEYSNSYGSSNMQYLDVAYDMIMPQYLMNLLKSNRLTSHWDKNAIGADGRHFNFDTLMNLTFPLPSLAEQDALVSAYNNKISLSEALEKQAAQVEQDIEEYLLSELGIKQKGYTQAEVTATIASEPQMEYVVNNRQLEDQADTYHWGDAIKKEYKYLKFVRFKDVERWDVSFFSQKNSIIGNYDTIPMSKCLDSFMQDQQGNTLRIETSKYPETPYQYIGMENIEKETGMLTEERIVKGADIKSQTVRVPRGFFLYGKLRPYLNKYWYNESDSENIVCSSEFFVFSIKNNINPYYFKFYLASRSVQQQITNAYRGARMPRINEETFKAIEVPIPPIDIQNSIVEHINRQKEQIKQLRLQAEKLRKEALEEFEKEIFE